MTKFLTAVTILGTLTVSATTTQAQPQLTPAVRNCLTKSVLAIGASVTMGTPRMVPGYRTLVTAAELYDEHHRDPRLPREKNSPLQNYEPRAYGMSPVINFARDMSGPSAIRNITYTGIYFTNQYSDLGSSQLDSMFDGERRELFEKASTIIGVDAFYWDAVFNNCGPNAGAPSRIPNWISRIKADGKTLVLGTVPQENSAQVKINVDFGNGRGLWQSPQPKCAAEINQSLRQYCTPENNCYVVDLAATVETLGCGQKLRLRDGRAFGLFEMRPDGVHLSDVGNQYIAELIENALAASPPNCN